MHLHSKLRDNTQKKYRESIVIQLFAIELWSDSNKIGDSDAVIVSTSQRRGLNLKSCNVWILCCDNIPFAKTRAPHVLHLSIIRPVLVGLSVAIELQNRQCTIRSHESITDNFLWNNIAYLSYIYSDKDPSYIP